MVVLGAVACTTNNEEVVDGAVDSTVVETTSVDTTATDTAVEATVETAE